MKKIIIALCSIFLLTGCSKDSEENTPESPKKGSEKIQIEELKGHIQKGPYVNGTETILFELDEALAQTGISFNTQVSTNDGGFEIDSISLSSQYVEISANGYYYDEVKGEISSSQLNLFALSDIESVSAVNVNLLTHLEKERVEYLVEEGKSFAEAKKMAQEEILAIFNIYDEDIQSSELLDISKNAVLLTISSILQGDRSVDDLNELLESISSDIAEDGVLDDAGIQEELRESALNLNAAEIRNNLTERYASLGLEVNIPGFQQYVESFLNYTATKPEILSVEVNVITADSVAVMSRVVANNSETEVVFEYGETEDLGKALVFADGPVNGSQGSSLEEVLLGLKPGTTYSYRITASNEIGSVSSEISNFTTSGGLPEEVGNLTLEAGINSIKVQGTVNPNSLETDVYVQYTENQESFDLSDSIQVDQNPLDPYADGMITAKVENLNPGTHYWLRLKIKNEAGVAYGDAVDIYTLGSKPEILQFVIEGVKANNAEAKFSINKNDLPSNLILEYSKTSAFENSVKYLDSVVGPFDADTDFQKTLKGLEMGQHYFVRLSVENGLGKDSSVLEFTTMDGVIKFTELYYDSSFADPEIHLYVNIEEEGGLEVQERGLLYSLSPGLKLENGDAIRVPDSLNNESYFNTYLPDLEAGQIYYARGYAINEAGVFYTNEIEFESFKLPEVETLEVGGITSSSAMIYGVILSTGGAPDFISGVCYSTSPNVTIENTTTISEEGMKALAIENLEPDTEYYVRFFGQNSVGVTYGEELIFKTNP